MCVEKIPGVGYLPKEGFEDKSEQSEQIILNEYDKKSLQNTCSECERGVGGGGCGGCEIGKLLLDILKKSKGR